MYAPFDIETDDKQPIKRREDSEGDDGNDSCWEVF